MREDSSPSERPVEGPPLLTAKGVIEWRRRRAGLPLPVLPEAALLTHQGYLLPRRRPWEHRAEASGFSFDLRVLAGERLVVAGVRGVGAPATAVAIEELAAAGVRRLVAVDVAGSLVERVRSGDAVLVERAFACDGTSPHYATGQDVWPDSKLTERIRTGLGAGDVTCVSGAAWSTDAVYRELPRDLDEARGRGALVADMETGCVFAVAGALGLDAAAVLVAADELYGGWRPPGDMERVHAKVRRVAGAVTSCLVS